MARQLKRILKYGIGEILLVTVGILVALQINNWNDQRKSRQELKTILATVQNDLTTNMVECDALIEHFNDEIKKLNLVFDSTTNEDTLRNCIECYTANVGFADLVIKTRGLEMLHDFKSQHSVASDSLILLIDAFYTNLLRYNSTMSDLINKDVLDNLKYYRDNYSWYEQLIAGNLTDEIRSEIRSNVFTRNRMYHYRVLVQSNYLRLLNSFKSQGQIILDRLEDLDKK